MTSLLIWLKSAKWVLYLILAVAAGILLLTLRKMFVIPRPIGPNRLPDVPPALQAKVEKAQEEALKAKVAAKVTADTDKQELTQILQIDDGVERRKRLAEKLRTL
jgi:uncharacterized membrane protein YdfJ with MMPL/SSD domain